MRTILYLLIGVAGLIASPTARAEEPRQLWLYYPTNLQVGANVDKLEPIWRQAAAAGYSHVLIADTKMAKLGDLGGMEKVYMGNVQRVKKIAADLKLELVPSVFNMGYSEAMLWHDPNLAEGLPVKDALFVVADGKAQIVAEPPVALKAKPDWKDDSVMLDGGVMTMKTVSSGNQRFTFKLDVAPWRCYHVSVKIKTEGWRGEPEIKALAGKQSLQWQRLGVKPSQDWTEHHVIFNSLENKEVAFYFGVWGSAKGTLRWKDWKVEEAGLVNVLRREGTPLVVKGYVEGKDFEPVTDPRMGNVPWKGGYEVWHAAPVIRTKGITDGTKLRVSWYHPAIVYDGQVACCLSDEKTFELLADEAKRVKAAFGTRGYMMAHDEIRVANWDESCRKLNLDAGAILARNVKRCTKLLGDSTIYTWSDMFDPTHNAHGDYYLVRGNWAGSWEGLDSKVVIMNWNFGKRAESLKWFADRGHRQIIAGYYDGPMDQVKQWLVAARGVKGVIGVMYTTWQNDYSQIEAFARTCRGE